mmetsp:Transcript_2987/g.9034  ORF Transcript_2987/g.9034 Transcript_2987/m.9034 type:complete len:97 (-) Transcript_2987:3083-3373(-)
MFKLTSSFHQTCCSRDQTQARDHQTYSKVLKLNDVPIKLRVKISNFMLPFQTSSKNIKVSDAGYQTYKTPWKNTKTADVPFLRLNFRLPEVAYDLP